MVGYVDSDLVSLVAECTKHNYITKHLLYVDSCMHCVMRNVMSCKLVYLKLHIPQFNVPLNCYYLFHRVVVHFMPC